METKTIRRLFWAIVCLAALLLVSVPGVAEAASPEGFAAQGAITGISTGVVKASGNSGRWQVIDREITGLMSGDIDGAFSVTYRGNVELQTQAGNFRGTLSAGPITFRLEGKSLPLEIVYFDPLQTYLPKLTMKGNWNNADVAGHGTFDGWCIFIPTPDGHVASIVASSFQMAGKWQP